MTVMIRPIQLNWIVTAFFAVIVAVVFQQIQTSMTQQGIASGGPYDNAAAFPRAVTIAIAVLVFGQFLLDLFRSKQGSANEDATKLEDLKRPALLLVVFALYLSVLTVLGYHLTTAPMVFGIMWVCGARKIPSLVVSSLAISFVAAYIFEKALNVVLPGGYFALNIPW